MSEQTLAVTPGVDGDRSAPAEAGARRAPAAPGVGGAADTEVVAVAKRRQHTGEYRLRILAEIDANPDKTGVILRREGLYSSYLSKWRQWRDGMSAEKKPTSGTKQMHNELAMLKRENARMKLKLEKAEGLIELQKKTSEMLEMMSRKARDES